MATKQQIVQEFVNYVQKQGGAYSTWYVGVAADSKKRMFNDHNVNEKQDSWIYHPCSSSEEARDIEDYFIRQGMKGGSGGGDDDTTYVYAYKITSTTRE